MSDVVVTSQTVVVMDSGLSLREPRNHNDSAKLGEAMCTSNDLPTGILRDFRPRGIREAAVNFTK